MDCVVMITPSKGIQSTLCFLKTSSNPNKTAVWVQAISWTANSRQKFKEQGLWSQTVQVQFQLVWQVVEPKSLLFPNSEM